MKDSVKLLRECEAEGQKTLMWFEKVQEETENIRIKRIVSRYEKLYQRFCLQINREMTVNRKRKRELTPVKKAEIWFRLHSGLLMRHTDSEIASLLSDACFESTKRLCRTLNQCPKAEQNSIALIRELIRMQECCTEELRNFL